MELNNNLDANISLQQVKPMLNAKAEQHTDQVGDALGSFGDMLKNEVDKINALNAQANHAVQTYATGGNIELHNVILAVEKADMALQLATQVRNRMVSAYQEVMRMNV